MNETAICGACVQAMYFNGTEWVNFSKGYSRIDIYKDATSYRLVGIKLEDMNIVINSVLNSAVQFRAASETFHQMSDGRSIFGFQYADVEEAKSMKEGFERAISASTASPVQSAQPIQQSPQIQQTPQIQQSQPTQQAPSGGPPKASPPAPQAAPPAAPISSPPTAPAAAPPPPSNSSSEFDSAPSGSLASALQSVRLKKKPEQPAAAEAVKPPAQANARPSIASLQAQIKLPTPAATPSPAPAKAPIVQSNTAKPPLTSNKSLENVALDPNMTALKNEILKEVKKELEIMKNEILQAMKSQ